MALTSTSRTSKLAAVVLISVNLVALSAWLMLLTLGVWTATSPATLSAALQTLGSDTVKALLPREVLSPQLGAGVALVSAALGLLCFTAVYAAAARSAALLLLYSMLVVLLLLLECALLYYFSSYFLERGLQSQDGQWSHALRLAFRCCEHNATEDLTGVDLPWSCCGVAAFPNNCSVAQLHTGTCHAAVSRLLHRHQTAVYASLAATHVLLASCSLARRRRAPSRSHT